MKPISVFPILVVILSLFAAPSTACGQSLFQTAKPDVLVLVKKHPSGADIVQISMIAPNFPAKILEERLTALCGDLGYGPNGLQIYTSDVGAEGNNMRFLKARFGTNGLIDMGSGKLRLQAVARCFAGIPAPNTITGIGVTFDGWKPGKQTLKSFHSKAVDVEAQYNGPPAEGLEYRISLLSQDPTLVTIPDQAEAAKPKAEDQGRTRVESPGWITWLLLGMTALVFGALVYFVFLRFNDRRR